MPLGQYPIGIDPLPLLLVQDKLLLLDSIIAAGNWNVAEDCVPPVSPFGAVQDNAIRVHVVVLFRLWIE